MFLQGAQLILFLFFYHPVYATDFWVFLLLFLRLSDVCQADGATNGVIAFEKGSITVDETAGSIPIKVVRTGATAGSFVVIVAV